MLLRLQPRIVGRHANRVRVAINANVAAIVLLGCDHGRPVIFAVFLRRETLDVLPLRQRRLTLQSPPRIISWCLSGCLVIPLSTVSLSLTSAYLGSITDILLPPTSQATPLKYPGGGNCGVFIPSTLDTAVNVLVQADPDMIPWDELPTNHLCGRVNSRKFQVASGLPFEDPCLFDRCHGRKWYFIGLFTLSLALIPSHQGNRCEPWPQ